jgi:hypothetical protein
LVVIALLGLAAPAPVGAAQAVVAEVTSVTSRSLVDEATCANFIATLRAGASTLSSAQQAVLPSLKPTDCRWVETSTKTPSSQKGADVIGSQMTATATSCGTFDKSLSLYLAGISIMTMRVRVGMCWNGSTAWRNWGPDCYFPSFPLYATTITWCGVYNNNHLTTEPGMNGTVAPMALPFWIIGYPWMRYQVYATGGSSSPWGAAGGV